MYAIHWQAVVVVWQIGSYQESVEVKPGIHTFWDAFGVLIQGALVPLIVSSALEHPTPCHLILHLILQAIYPTVIIILVALNRSQVEHGFERDDGPGFPNPTRPPLRTLTATIGSIATQKYDDGHRAVLHGIEPRPTGNSVSGPS